MLDHNVTALVHWRAFPLQTLAGACAILNVSAPTAYKLERDGKLTFKRLGNRTMVTTTSIIDYLDTAQDWSPSASPNPLAHARNGAA